MKHSASILMILFVAGFVCAPAFAQIDVGGDIKVLGVYVDTGWDTSSDYDDWGDKPGDDGIGDIDLDDLEDLLSDSSDGFFRLEAHLWAQADLEENVTARISMEVDKTFSNEDAATFGTCDMLSDVLGLSASNWGRPSSNDMDLFLEEAYIQASDIFDWPWTVTVGRQFMQLGSGFVVGDAVPYSPADIFIMGEHEQDPFDAIRIDWDLGEEWSLLMAFTRMAETRLIDMDVDLYVANLAFTGIEDAVIEAYYLFYDNNGWCASNMSLLGMMEDDGIYVEEAKIHQVGIRGDFGLNDWIDLTGEATWQFADEIETDEGNADVGGYAVEAGIKLTPEAMDEYDGAFGFTFTWLSGDDDLDDEDYDSYIQLADNKCYGEIADFYSGLVSNDMMSPAYAGIYIFNLDGEMTFDDLRLAVEAYYFMAQEDVWYYDYDKEEYDKDDSIGWEVDVYAEYPLTEDLKAHAAAGFFDPDDAAEGFAGIDDTAFFGRAGLTVNF